jgi:hypothetical protein
MERQQERKDAGMNTKMSYVSCKVTRDDLALIKGAARVQNISTSEFVKRALLKELTQQYGREPYPSFGGSDVMSGDESRS